MNCDSAEVSMLSVLLLQIHESSLKIILPQKLTNSGLSFCLSFCLILSLPPSLCVINFCFQTVPSSNCEKKAYHILATPELFMFQPSRPPPNKIGSSYHPKKYKE